jgi:hypothetical protein
MGLLTAINVPFVSGFRRPVILVLGAIALAGLAVMLIGRLTKVDESDESGLPRIKNGEPSPICEPLIQLESTAISAPGSRPNICRG